MARIRGVLIDNTTAFGAIYTNITKTDDAINSPSHNLAVIKNSQFSVTTKAAGTSVQVVNDVSGWKAPNIVTITQVNPVLRGFTTIPPFTPAGTPLTVRVRKREAISGVDTTVATVSIPAATTITNATATSTANNITCGSTSGLSVGMPIYFTAGLGGIAATTNYYVSSVVNSTTFQISSSLGGTPLALLNSTGSVGIVRNITSVVSNINVTLLKNDILFTDVTQIGSTRAGQGLITYYYYY